MPGQKTNLNISLDFRIVSGLLLAAIIVMLAIWMPWQSHSDRTVKVSGEAVIKSEPDEFVFYPNYEFKNADKQIALQEVSKKSDEVVSKLKELGVSDSKIKTTSSGYDTYYKNDDGTLTYTLQLTITVGNKDLSQKVQDYLVSTSPTGNVSPQATFSQAKRKELEGKARDEATKDARAKADQSARNLGFKVAKVKTVEDGQGFGEVYPLAARGATTMALDSAAGSAPVASLNVHPGENEINYSVTVTYYVR